MQTPTALLISYLEANSGAYAHWIGLYLSFHLNWVLSPFVRDRLQILQTSEVTFAHVITPLTIIYIYVMRRGNVTTL